MSLTACDIMESDVRTVRPEMTLPELERAFLSEKVSGFPVLEDGKLVGIVSRSDVIRQLGVEQSMAEVISDYHRAGSGVQDQEDALKTLKEIGAQVGERIEGLLVRDVMIRKLLTVTPDTPLREVAEMLVDHHVHRLLVTEDGQLLGIVSTLDLVQLFAEGGFLLP